MIQIGRETVDALGFDLAEAVASFTAEVEAHRLTVDVPAPSAHPLVEAIVRRHGGEFGIIEPEPKPDPEPLPPSKRVVLKSVIISRLIEAKKIEAARAALDSDAALYARWWAPDRPVINYDDPDAIALLDAIGADPGVILAE